MHGRLHCFIGALIIVIQAAFPLFVYAQDTIRIEAENYSAMSGVQTEPSADVGGGLNVGWIETNDWLSYTLDVPETGHYTVRYRVASESAGGHFHLGNPENNTTLDEIDFNATGGWQSWVTVESDMELSAGSQTLVITALQPGWNINWIEFQPSSNPPTANIPQHCVSSPIDPYAPINIEAEHYVRMAGVQTEETSDEGGGLNLAWIEPQDTMTYAVELAHGGLYKASYRVASRETEGRFQLEPPGGGQVYDSVNFPPTGDWQDWTTVETSVVLPAGPQELTIRALSQDWNINWLQLELISPDASGTRVRAEDYSAMYGVQAEPTEDFGGGMNIGYIESGDWISYALNIPETGLYDIHYRLASLQNGGHFRLLAQSLDEPVDEVSFPATGGWQSWTTVSSRVQLEEGDQQLRIESLDHGWNINWFELVPAPASQDDCETIRTQAQHYNDMQGVQSEITLDNSGGLNLGWIHSGDWMAYPLALPHAGRYQVSYRVASPYPASFQVENAQGEILDTVQFAATGGWQDWVTLESELMLEEESQLVIKSLSDEWNINWFDLAYIGNSSSSSSFSNISSSSSSYSSSSESSESSSSSSSWVGSSSSSLSSVSSESSSSSSDEVSSSSTSENSSSESSESSSSSSEVVSSSSNSSVSSGSSSESSSSVNSESSGSSSSWISSSDSSSSSVSSESTSSSSDGVSSSSSSDSSISLSSESSDSSSSWTNSSNSSLSSSISSTPSSSSSEVSSSESSDWSSSSLNSSSSNSSESNDTFPVDEIFADPGDRSVTIYWDEMDQSGLFDVYVTDYILNDDHDPSESEGMIKLLNMSSPTYVNGLENGKNYYAYVFPSNEFLMSGSSHTAFIPSSGEGLLGERYEVLAGGVVEDIVTGLQWRRCSYGNNWNGEECVGSIYATTRIGGSSLYLEGGWRVPTLEELSTLIYCSSGDPWYWSPYGRYPISSFWDSYEKCEGDYNSPTIDDNVFRDIEYSGRDPANFLFTYSYLTSSSQYFDHLEYSPFSEYVDFHRGVLYRKSNNWSSYILLVNENKHPRFVLKINKIGEGNVSSNVDAMNCGNTCEYLLSSGRTIDLLATPAEGYRFSHWDGICEGQGSRCELESITQEETVTAHFEEGGAGRFRLLEDGVVWDTKTGLEWERCAYGRTWEGNDCVDEEMPIIWSQHEALNEGRWRLPESHEFGTIIHCSSGEPVEWNPGDSGCVADPDIPDFYFQLGWAITIDRRVFPGAMAGPYWTATSNSENTAVSVSLVDGSKTERAKNLQGIAFRVRDREVYHPAIESGQTTQLDMRDSPLSEGDVTSHQWVSSSTGEILSTENTLELDNLSAGRHVFELRLVDGNGNEYSDYFVVAVGDRPEIVVENPVTAYTNESLRIDASQSRAGDESLFFRWEKDGELLSEMPYVDILAEEAESFDLVLTVTTMLGFSSTEVVQVTVEDPTDNPDEVGENLEHCPYNPIEDDSNLYLPNPDNNIEWTGGFAQTVEDILSAFNYARRRDPSVHQYLLMPPQVDWDAMDLQEKGLYLVNAERMARGIKPYSGYDASIVGVAQEYSDYILDNNLIIDHYYRDESPMDRLMSNNYTSEYADGYIEKPESISALYSSLGEVDVEYALVRTIYNWVYHDKEWYKELGYDNGEDWVHRDHILQTGLYDNHADSISEGVIGFGVATGFYDPDAESPDSYGGVTVFNTIDQGENWHSNRIDTIDTSQAQGCIPNDIDLPDLPPDLVGLESLRIEPESMHLAVGQQKPISLIGINRDGSEVDLSQLYNQSATDNAIVNISQGVIEALAPGRTKKYFRIDDIESNRIHITVGQPINGSDFDGTDAESIAPYLADNATVSQPLNAADERVVDYDSKAMSVYTGLVTNRYGVPVSGVNVSFLKARNYGSVETDNEGRFMLAGPSGKQTLVYEKSGHLVVQRTTTASSSQWATLETVVLLPRDTKVTHIDLASGEPQVHQSSTIVDEFGERKATVVFNNVSAAEIHSWDGSVRSIDNFTLSATEFELPASMPGELPDETAFTWATDLYIESTHFSDSVHFDGNVVMYVDNFLGFPVGEIVPIGYFDRLASEWVASSNGIVVQLLDQNNDGIVDGVDYTGDAIADDLNGNGSTLDEALGLESYAPGDTLWWGSFTHMTPYDYNYAPQDAEAPEETETEKEEEESCDNANKDGGTDTGSRIDAYQQTFHEEIPIAGTNITLNYSSRRTSGYQHRIRVRVSGEEISPSLENMIARLEIAGHVFEQEFFPEPNVVAEFIWDGNHPDGTRAQGLVSGRVSIGYEYQTMYLSAGNAAEEDQSLSSFPVAWATLSDVVTQVPGRERFIAWQEKVITLKSSYETQLAEGWSLSAVHELDPRGKVYLGSGKAFDVVTPHLILKTGLTYSHVRGDDGYYQAGGSDINYTITDRNTLFDRVTGLEWQYTQQPFRTRSWDEAAAYCENEAEPRELLWRLPTEKEVGYTVDKSGGSAGRLIYNMELADGLWRQNTSNNSNRLIGTVCVSGPILGHDIDESLERNNADEVVVDNNGLMWQDTMDNEVLTLGWEESINYCEDSLHAGYDDWRLPNINELLYTLPNETFVHQTTLPPSFGVWSTVNPYRRPYWSSTSDFQNEELAWASESNGFNSPYFIKDDAYHVRCVRQDSTASRMPLRFNGENQHVASFDMLSGTEYQFIDYNADGQVIGIEDQFDNRLVIERNSLGQPVRLIAPDGQITELSINDANHLTQVLYEDASRYDFTYSEGGLLTEKIDPRGERYTRQYNDIGRVEQAADPAGGLWQTFNNKLGLNESLFGYTTAEGNTQQVEQRVLPNGDTLQTTTTLSGAERVRLTSEDQLTESITAYGMSQVIHKELDEKTLQPVPRQITVTAPSGLTRTTGITKTFAQNGADTSAYTLTVDDNGDISTTVVDGGEGTWVHTSAEGRTATIHTDPDTLLTERIQVPGLHDSHSVYDDRGRLVEAHTGDRVTRYSYNASGYLASITASDNRVTDFEYDLLGRTTRIHYPDGFSTAFEYDANGNATKVTVPTQEVHDFTFTAINQVETENQPPSTTTAYTYNREKALTEIQLPSGESIHYDYDSARLQQMQTPEGVTEYRYQQGDQLHEVETGAELARYHYDGTLLTGLEYEGELNTRIDYGYDNHFRTNNVTYAGDSTSIGYDQDGLITAIHGYSLDYHPQNGLPESMANGNWRKQWSWTPYGEVSAVSHQLGAQESYGYTLEYNQAGQISQKTERRHDGTLVTYDYTYDNRYRLIEVRENNSVTESYSYDANGNRTNITSVHRGITQQPATYAAGDQLQSQGNTSYSYDANGRLASRLTTVEGEEQLTTYVYSSLGQLRQVDTPEQSIEYRHNALGQRVAKLVNGQVTEKYLWRDLTTLLAIYDANGNVKQRFEHTLGHTPTSFTQNGERYFIQSDHLGSPRVITDSSGNVIKTIDYDSYGNIIHDSNEGFEIPFGFAGGLYDKDTGLIRFGFRDYDPNTSRWTARDPIGFAGGDTNLYGYVLGDPVNEIDTLGLSPIGPVLDILFSHWERNENNEEVSDLSDVSDWTELTKDESIFHQMGDGNEDNRKFVSEDGHSEAVFDCDGNLVTDISNIGTYNYFGPREMLGIPHAIFDVFPYFLFGNSPSDMMNSQRFETAWNHATK